MNGHLPPDGSGHRRAQARWWVLVAAALVVAGTAALLLVRHARQPTGRCSGETFNEAFPRVGSTPPTGTRTPDVSFAARDHTVARSARPRRAVGELAGVPAAVVPEAPVGGLFEQLLRGVDPHDHQAQPKGDHVVQPA